MKHETKYALVSLVAASLAGMAVRATLRRAWLAKVGRPPPSDPSSHEVRWSEALGWSLASAGFVALGRVLAKRATAAGWRFMRGEAPPIA